MERSFDWLIARYYTPSAESQFKAIWNDYEAYENGSGWSAWALRVSFLLQLTVIQIFKNEQPEFGDQKRKNCLWWLWVALLPRLFAWLWLLQWISALCKQTCLIRMPQEKYYTRLCLNKKAKFDGMSLRCSINKNIHSERCHAHQRTYRVWKENKLVRFLMLRISNKIKGVNLRVDGKAHLGRKALWWQAPL